MSEVSLSSDTVHVSKAIPNPVVMRASPIIRTFRSKANSIQNSLYYRLYTVTTRVSV